ncbi:MAG: hypothetical protein A2087_00680 [Spirochaetes bacterium GWD1_61_31]|nr:MAG: hypothetical protein A2Y37_03105 [Spirochaetes bacterium GWB1_60_80]OHD29599.1 MAG: hypothetical protein A2004_01640 [Spirochaetes bacterium GWC1_61_12]OHD37503.1 MAG: hypothetical protein A2087_00680 [Spirochaetes bacterium GWD1_61_31]OHD41987.1 MAG: hypothetical protein A2Y35_14585 [Spirochaetes bacterium GWE1_60_18]
MVQLKIIIFILGKDPDIAPDDCIGKIIYITLFNRAEAIIDIKFAYYELITSMNVYRLLK